MRQLKDAIMTHTQEVTVSTTAGFTVRFRPGKKERIPAYAVPECLHHGAKIKAFIKGTEKTRIRAPENAGVKSHVNYAVENIEEIEEVDFDPAELASDNEAPKQARNSVSYTETENIVRRGIEKVLDAGNPDDFTNDYLPKTGPINEHVENMTVKKEHRDRVWGKMLQNGEVTEAMLDEIFGADDSEEAEVDDTDAAA